MGKKSPKDRKRKRTTNFLPDKDVVISSPEKMDSENSQSPKAESCWAEFSGVGPVESEKREAIHAS